MPPQHGHPGLGGKNFKPSGFCGCPTDRVKDLLDCITIQRIKAASQDTSLKGLSVEELMKGAYADVSQSHTRRCFCYNGSPVPTLTTSTILYSFDLDSVVHPLELYRWHGFPRSLEFPSEAGISTLRSLLGNGMCAPCLGQSLVALLILLYESDNLTQLSRSHERVHPV